MIEGWTKHELLHEALVAPRTALISLPDTMIIDSPRLFQVITPSLMQGGPRVCTSSDLRQHLAQTLANHAPPPFARAVEGVRIGGQEAGVLEREPRAP